VCLQYEVAIAVAIVIALAVKMMRSSSLMINNYIAKVAQNMYTDTKQKDDMVRDMLLLVQALKLSLPLVIMVLIGFSSSIISVIMEVGLLCYYYAAIINFYRQIRIHRRIDRYVPDSTKEIRTLLAQLWWDIMSKIR